MSWAQGCFYLANKAYPQLQTDKEPVVPVVMVRSVLRATQSVMILQRNCLNVVSGSFQQNKMRHIFFHGPLCACISLPLPGHSNTMLRPALAREAAGRDHHGGPGAGQRVRQQRVRQGRLAGQRA